MTRRGPERQVDDRFWVGRLDNARTFLRAADALSDLAEEGENANPIVALIVLAAVGGFKGSVRHRLARPAASLTVKRRPRTFERAGSFTRRSPGTVASDRRC